MLQQLRYLVELQVLEDRKSDVIRGYNETPRRIAEIEQEYTRFEQALLTRKAESDHARKMRRSLEQSIADLENRIARCKIRMNEVKTNKEYQAILREIDDFKAEIRRKEDEALEVMEQIDTLSKEVQTLETEAATHKIRMEADRKVLQEEADRLKERLDQFDALAAEIRAKIDPNLLKRCDSLLSRQAGIAVAPVEGGTCQVCHLNIPPQKFIELQRDEAIMQCPHCHRFLFWTGHEAYLVMEEDLGFSA
ncbi:MAG: C4-type zinc ribbon domain-containing protein [Desulfobacterota bacterium]|nr:C4-type zinc ribbon domain-containing protein [Thermodesulfobacteriota bacterium]